jgi:hypothetical protein
MTYGTNPDFLQVLLGQVREDPLVDLVVAECRLVLFEAQAPQPDHHVHDGAHNQWWRTSSSGVTVGVQGGILRASQSPLRSNGNGRSLVLF